MDEAGFNTHELSELSRAFLRTAEERYPKLAKKFLTQQGTKGKKLMRQEIKSRVGHLKRDKGDKTSLRRGVGKSRITQHKGDYQVRVYNKANHAWLVEHGHSNVKTRDTYNGNWRKTAIPVGTPVVMVPGRGGVGPLFIGRDGAVKQIEGRHYAAATAKRMKAEYPDDVEVFLDELMGEGLEL